MEKIQPEMIDWNELWKQSRSDRSYKVKNAKDWDKKAPAFAQRNSVSHYIDKFIELLKPHPSWSVLDIGCGPGTLAIPLARTVKKINAIDFSPEMINILSERARKEGLTNISTHTLSWTDDWHQNGIKIHDITIASRSLAVDDLRPALEKLTSFAKKKVVITDKVGTGPFDPQAFSAVGRELKTGPDYIYTVNLLYQMGIKASVDFIRLEDTLPCSSLAEGMDYYTWMFHDLSADEKKRLKKYVQSITTSTDDGKIIIRRKHVPTWAFLHWEPQAP